MIAETHVAECEIYIYSSLECVRFTWLSEFQGKIEILQSMITVSTRLNVRLFKIFLDVSVCEQMGKLMNQAGMMLESSPNPYTFEL